MATARGDQGPELALTGGNDRRWVLRFFSGRGKSCLCKAGSRRLVNLQQVFSGPSKRRRSEAPRAAETIARRMRLTVPPPASLRPTSCRSFAPFRRPGSRRSPGLPKPSMLAVSAPLAAAPGSHRPGSMCQPRQFALASALSVACQPVAVKAELPVKSALFGIIPTLDLSRAMSRQPRRYFAVQNFVENSSHGDSERWNRSKPRCARTALSDQNRTIEGEDIYGRYNYT
jgi:hypothetical protein